MDFLLRLAPRMIGVSRVSRPCVSFRKGGPMRRASSPLPARSTLMTSAPRSPRVCAASGPASTRERSSTRMCDSGGFLDMLELVSLEIRFAFFHERLGCFTMVLRAHQHRLIVDFAAHGLVE